MFLSSLALACNLVVANASEAAAAAATFSGKQLLVLLVAAVVGAGAPPCEVWQLCCAGETRARRLAGWSACKCWSRGGGAGVVGRDVPISNCMRHGWRGSCLGLGRDLALVVGLGRHCCICFSAARRVRPTLAARDGASRRGAKELPAGVAGGGCGSTRDGTGIAWQACRFLFPFSNSLVVYEDEATSFLLATLLIVAIVATLTRA